MAALYDSIVGHPKGAARSRAVCHAQARSAWSGGRAHPTLRPGDLVSTAKGLMAFGGKSAQGDAFFTPVDPTILPTNLRPPPSQFVLPPTTEPSRETMPGTNVPTGAVHERANEQLYPREPRTCLPTPSGSRWLADLAQSWGHHPSLWVCGAGRNFLWALPRASCRSAQPNCRLKVRVTPKADDIR